MKYTTRGMRRRSSDKWEVVLTYRDPLTGELLPTYHTIAASTEKQAKKKRDELIVRLEIEGGAVGSNITLRDFMHAYLDVREKDGTLEPSTVRGYRADAKQILKYVGDVQLGELSIPDVSGWMSSMTADGYAPKTGSSVRTIPLTNSIYNLLTHMKKASVQQAVEFGVPFGNLFILGTQKPESRPYNPTQLGKDFGAFCKMNGFDCTFHDLRHTFATMMIVNGCDGSSVKKTCPLARF